jgi:Flp pilus assembly pilin Flp
MRVPSPSLRRLDPYPLAVLALLADARGVTSIEYALITVLIVMSLVILISQIGDFVSTPFETIAARL